MVAPLEICFNGMGRSDFIESLVRKQIHQLEKHRPDITNFYIAVSAPHKCHRKGNQFEVHIRAHVPGAELAVRHHYASDDPNTEIGPLIRDAFAALDSQLRKRKNKKHKSNRTALIDETFSDGDQEHG